MTSWKWYHFGPFRFDGDLLYRGDSRPELPEREAKILRRLVERWPHLVRREELEEFFGQGATSARVDAAICRLRGLLGDGYIDTLPGRGYVFAKDVSVIDEPDAEATRHYHRGLLLWNEREPGALWKAKECFELAIQRDRTFAAAHAALGDCFAILGSYWWRLAPRDAALRAKAAAERALELAPSLAQPHATLGFVHSLFERRWSEAQKRFQRSLELSPRYGVGHHWFALHLAATGDLARARQEIDEARKCDSLARGIEVHAATIRYWARDYGAAERLCETAILVNPNFYYAHYQLGLIYEQQGRFDEAVAKQRDAAEHSPEEIPYVSVALARAYALAGRREEAERELAKVVKSETVFFHAVAHVALKNDTLAFEYLKCAVEAQDVWISFAAIDPRMDPLRGDPRFAALLASIGLAHVKPPPKLD